MEDADILWPSRPYPANLQTLNSEPCTLSLTSGRLPTIFGEAILTAKELVRSCPCLPLTMAVTESMMQQLRLSGVADPKEAVLVPSAGMTLWILEVRAVLVPSAGMTLWILEVRVAGWNRVVDTGGTGGGEERAMNRGAAINGRSHPPSSRHFLHGGGGAAPFPPRPPHTPDDTHALSLEGVG